jgi:hypothetical protein
VVNATGPKFFRQRLVGRTVAMDGLNCHFVTRFLTKPWEIPPGRTLHFYDFAEKAIRTKSSRSLFARIGLNDADTESRINSLIETPLARLIAELKTGPPDFSKMQDWAVFRAVSLLFSLQISRSAKLTSGNHKAMEFYDWPTEKIDQYTWAIHEKRTLLHFVVPANVPLAYTPHGYFFVPLPDVSLTEPGIFSIPLTPTDALVLLPKSADIAGINSALTRGQGAYLSNASCGTNASQVVFHPEILEHFTPAQICEAFEVTRANNLMLSKLCQERLALLRQQRDLFSSLSLDR